MSDYYHINKDKIKKQNNEYRIKNKDKINAYARQYYKNFRNKILESNKHKYNTDEEYRKKKINIAKKWVISNREKRKIVKHNNYLKSKIAYEIRHYGRPRKEILEFFKYTCQACGSMGDSKLHIHHKDYSGNLRNNLNKMPINNNINNLTVVCGSCHIKNHGKSYAKKAKYCINLYEYVKDFASKNNIPLPLALTRF